MLHLFFSYNFQLLFRKQKKSETRLQLKDRLKSLTVDLVNNQLWHIYMFCTSYISCIIFIYMVVCWNISIYLSTQRWLFRNTIWAKMLNRALVLSGLCLFLPDYKKTFFQRALKQTGRNRQTDSQRGRERGGCPRPHLNICKRNW